MFFLLFSGCLDSGSGNTDDKITFAAVLELSQETYGMSDKIEFGVRNTANSRLMVGRTFDLEFYNESSAEWETVEVDMETTLNLIILSPGDAFNQEFNPREVFVNEPEEGQYRIRKNVSIEDTGESLVLERSFLIVTQLNET